MVLLLSRLLLLKINIFYFIVCGMFCVLDSLQRRGQVVFCPETIGPSEVRVLLGFWSLVELIEILVIHHIWASAKLLYRNYFQKSINKLPSVSVA